MDVRSVTEREMMGFSQERVIAVTHRQTITDSGSFRRATLLSNLEREREKEGGRSHFEFITRGFLAGVLSEHTSVAVL